MALLAEIMEVVVIPLLGILTAYVVKLVNAKIEDINKERDNILEEKYLTMLGVTISDCVTATTQTYVESLKKQGKFDAEAQKEAFNQTYTAVMNILSEEAKKYLTVAVGDLNLYITQKIEAEVNANKATN
jgi:cell division protein ZapA (FtsZ GTPase activity inhibitor)